MYRAKKDGNSSGWPLSNLILTSDQVLRYSAGSTHGIIEQLKTNQRLGDYGLGQWMPEKGFIGTTLREWLRATDGRTITLYIRKANATEQPIEILPFYALWTNSVLCSAGLLEQVMGDPPCVSSLIRKQLRTCHVEDLPPIVPHGRVLLPIGLGQMRPNILLASSHFGQPVLVFMSALISEQKSN